VEFFLFALYISVLGSCDGYIIDFGQIIEFCLYEFLF
jgi:hypothetical protein